MTLEELAVVLKRKPGGVRVALAMRTEEWAINLSNRTIRIGRRVHFPTDSVAELLTGGLVESN